MKYLSLFSGVGGFELGINKAYEVRNVNRSKDRGGKEDTERNEGQRLQPQERKEVSTTERPVSERITDRANERPLCVGYSEIDKYAIKTYQHHFPNHKAYGDITKIDAEELPNFDLLVGGVPCQSWSIAGKRKGFEDERGSMWGESIKILRAKQPKYFLLENVKGLLSHDGGRSMEKICEELCEVGYAIDFEVLNAKNFGVPQNRERVFIVGIRLDLLDECQVF